MSWADLRVIVGAIHAAAPPRRRISRAVLRVVDVSNLRFNIVDNKDAMPKRVAISSFSRILRVRRCRKCSRERSGKARESPSPSSSPPPPPRSPRSKVSTSNYRSEVQSFRRRGSNREIIPQLFRLRRPFTFPTRTSQFISTPLPFFSLSPSPRSDSYVSIRLKTPPNLRQREKDRIRWKKPLHFSVSTRRESCESAQLYLSSRSPQRDTRATFVIRTYSHIHARTHARSRKLVAITNNPAMEYRANCIAGAFVARAASRSLRRSRCRFAGISPVRRAAKSSIVDRLSLRNAGHVLPISLPRSPIQRDHPRRCCVRVSMCYMSGDSVAGMRRWAERVR